MIKQPQQRQLGLEFSQVGVGRGGRGAVLGYLSRFFLDTRAFPELRTSSASLVALLVRNPSASAGDVRDVVSISGSGRSPGGGHGNPLQHSCLENPMDRGAWQTTVHGVTRVRCLLSKHAGDSGDKEDSSHYHTEHLPRARHSAGRSGCIICSSTPGALLCLFYR